MVSDVIELVEKTCGNKAQANRQPQILLITISLVLVQLSGCSPAPSSPLTQIDREPPGFPQIRLDENICPSQRLYNFLKQAGKGKIGPHANADYSITRLDLDSDIRISDRMASYRLYCEVSDNYNQKVIETFADRVVKGRFEPGTDYRETVSTRKYEDFIAKDAAIQLMNDLYKKMPTVVAAEPVRKK